jgi:hypothetical protein
MRRSSRMPAVRRARATSGGVLHVVEREQVVQRALRPVRGDGDLRPTTIPATAQCVDTR